jgi:L-amino acid N-acyltransferase YncA
MESHGGGFWRPETKCIGLERNGNLVAGVMYDWFNGASVYAHVVVKGRLTREYLWFIGHYPFEQLGAKVVIGLVSQDNKEAQKFDEHLGFRLTASIPEGHPSGDLLIYTLYKNQYKWLERKNVKTISTKSA